MWKYLGKKDMGFEEKKSIISYECKEPDYMLKPIMEIEGIFSTSDQCFKTVRVRLESYKRTSVKLMLATVELQQNMKPLKIKRKDFADISRRESWKRQHMRKTKKKSAAR